MDECVLAVVSAVDASGVTLQNASERSRSYGKAVHVSWDDWPRRFWRDGARWLCHNLSDVTEPDPVAERQAARDIEAFRKKYGGT